MNRFEVCQWIDWWDSASVSVVDGWLSFSCDSNGISIYFAFVCYSMLLCSTIHHGQWPLSEWGLKHNRNLSTSVHQLGCTACVHIRKYEKRDAGNVPLFHFKFIHNFDRGSGSVVCESKREEPPTSFQIHCLISLLKPTKTFEWAFAILCENDVFAPYAI